MPPSFRPALAAVPAAVSAALLAALLPDAAFAQSLPARSKPFRVKLGGSFFDNGVDAPPVYLPDPMASSQRIPYLFSAGVACDFSRARALTPNVYADFSTGSEPGTATATNADIGVAVRFVPTGGHPGTGHPFAEAGIGYYGTRLKIVGYIGGDETKTGANPGAKAALGYEWRGGVFGEFEYTFVRRFTRGYRNGDATYNPSGLKANLGYRF